MSFALLASVTMTELALALLALVGMTDAVGPARSTFA